MTNLFTGESTSYSVSSFLSEAFCSGAEPLLDYNLLWNSTSPVFSRCFRSTVPVWTPAAILLSLAPFEVYTLSRSIADSSAAGGIRPNLYNVSRMLVTAAVILANVIQFALNSWIHWRSHSEQLFAGELTAPLINAVTFVSCVKFFLKVYNI